MTKKKMTQKELNNRLHALLKEVDALTRECGQNIELWSHVPEEKYPNYYLGVMVGEFEPEKENRICVYPDDVENSWKDKPQFLISTFNYFKAVKYMQELRAWMDRVCGESKDA